MKRQKNVGKNAVGHLASCPEKLFLTLTDRQTNIRTEGADPTCNKHTDKLQDTPPSTYGDIIDEQLHALHVLADERVEVDHEGLLSLELHQIGQVLDSLGHQLQSPVCHWARQL